MATARRCTYGEIRGIKNTTFYAFAIRNSEMKKKGNDRFEIFTSIYCNTYCRKGTNITIIYIKRLTDVNNSMQQLVVYHGLLFSCNFWELQKRASSDITSEISYFNPATDLQHRQSSLKAHLQLKCSLDQFLAQQVNILCLYCTPWWEIK